MNGSADSDSKKNKDLRAGLEIYMRVNEKLTCKQVDEGRAKNSP